MTDSMKTPSMSDPALFAPARLTYRAPGVRSVTLTPTPAEALTLSQDGGATIELFGAVFHLEGSK